MEFEEVACEEDLPDTGDWLDDTELLTCEEACDDGFCVPEEAGWEEVSEEVSSSTVSSISVPEPCPLNDVITNTSLTESISTWGCMIA